VRPQKPEEGMGTVILTRRKIKDFSLETNSKRKITFLIKEEMVK
jgi:hypothetical protein